MPLWNNKQCPKLSTEAQYQKWVLGQDYSCKGALKLIELTEDGEVQAEPPFQAGPTSHGATTSLASSRGSHR